jgi:hypothetical protein
MDIEAMKEELIEDRAALEAERVELRAQRESIDERLKELGGELRANKRLLLAASPRPRPVKLAVVPDAPYAPDSTQCDECGGLGILGRDSGIERTCKVCDGSGNVEAGW